MCFSNGRTKGINKATEIHHKYRRVGSAFLDVGTWLSACRECNNRVEVEPGWAYFNHFLATPEEKTKYYENKD
jgi:hypothetical protein